MDLVCSFNKALGEPYGVGGLLGYVEMVLHNEDITSVFWLKIKAPTFC